MIKFPNKFVEEAYNQALKSPLKARYGAVIGCRNHIISRGHNEERRGFKGTKWKMDRQEQCILCL